MRSDFTPEFDAANNALNREPRFVVKINFTTPIFITSHSDVVISDPGDVCDGMLKGTATISQTLVPDEGRSQIGTMSFEVVDQANSLSFRLRQKLGNGEGVRGRFIEFYTGEKGLDWDKYALMQTQVADHSVELKDGVYQVNCRDILRELKRSVFDQVKTKLSLDYLIGGSVLTVQSTADFTPTYHDMRYSIGPGGFSYLLKIEYSNGFEIVRASSKTATTFNIVQRGLFGTKAIDHIVDPEADADQAPTVSQFIYLEGTGPELAYQILTGKNFAGSSVLPDNYHCGISDNLVEMDSFRYLDESLHNPTDASKGMILRFDDLEKTEGKRFIEKEICLLQAWFLRVGADGKLYAKRQEPVLSNSDYIDTLDETNIVRVGALKHDLSKVANVIDLQWAYGRSSNDKKPEFLRRRALIDAVSLGLHGIGEPKKLKFKGLHSDRHTQSTLKNQFDALRDRYAGPPIYINLDLLATKNKLEVGDVVRVNLANVQDFSGADNFDRPCEIQQIKIDQITQKVSVLLFTSSMPASVIADEDSIGFELPDSIYGSTGTDLNSVLTIDGSGILQADGTLNGGTTTRTHFYYNGDLTIPTGRTLTITGNVQLWVKGQFQVNGTIDGVGGGVPQSSIGTPGYIGSGSSGGGFLFDGKTEMLSGFYVKAKHTAVPQLNIVNDAGVLTGIPEDMRGSGGSAGRPVIKRIGPDLEPVGFGGFGGQGGSSIAIVCRGMGLGAAGQIDLSGDDGAPGALATEGPYDYYAGSGMGGGPGAMVVLLDGPTANFPNLAGKVIAQNGDCPSQGNPYKEGTDPWFSFSGKPQIDLGTSAARVFYVPKSRIPYKEETFKDELFQEYRWATTYDPIQPPPFIPQWKTEREPNDWETQYPQIGTGEFIWLIQAGITKENEIAGEWSDPKRFTNADGFYIEYLFQFSATQPATPTGAAPVGWDDAPGANPGGDPLWVTRGAIQDVSGELIGSWTTPQRVTDDLDTYPSGIKLQFSADGIGGWHGLPYVVGDFWLRQVISRVETSPGSGTYIEYWSEPYRFVNEESGSEQTRGFYVSFIFQHSLTQPATPTDDNPLGWLDGPDPGNPNPVWFTKAEKWLDDDTLKTTWSDPVRTTGEGMLTQYSPNGTDGWHNPPFVTGDLFMHHSFDDGQTWGDAIRIVGEQGAAGADGADGSDGDSITVQYSADAVNWHSTFQIGDLYMRQKIGAGSWSAEILIVGEDGDPGNAFSFIFKRSATQPATPTGSSPAGWSDAPPVSGTGKIWMSRGLKDASGVLIGSWSTPVQVEGDDGVDGNDGADGDTWTIIEEPQASYEGFEWNKDSAGTWTPGTTAQWMRVKVMKNGALYHQMQFHIDRSAETLTAIKQTALDYTEFTMTTSGGGTKVVSVTVTHDETGLSSSFTGRITLDGSNGADPVLLVSEATNAGSNSGWNNITNTTNDVVTRGTGYIFWNGVASEPPDTVTFRIKNEHSTPVKTVQVPVSKSIDYEPNPDVWRAHCFADITFTEAGDDGTDAYMSEFLNMGSGYTSISCTVRSETWQN